MGTIRAWGLAAVLTFACGSRGAEPGTPKIDKAQWETFLRYAEGYVAAVKFDIEDPKPTAVPGYFQVNVHLTSGESKLDRVYYTTGDGQSVLSGVLWDLRQPPFAENLKHLPSDGYGFGPANAPINIVVFSDFQCPYCSQFAKTMRTDLPKKYGDKVRVTFKDFPLSAIHPWARAAAESAHCLGDQKTEAFWAFHDWVFEHQKDVNAANLREKTMNLAKEQKLDENKLVRCLDSHAPAAAIDKSIEVGRQLQVQQTPTFFVNGRMENGALPWDRLDALLEFELSRPKQFGGPVGEKCCEVAIPKVGKE